MASERKQYDDDDGRVIVSMDVDGMPWHDKRARRETKMAERAASESNAARYAPQGESMTKSEALRYTWYAVLAGLSVVGVFSVALVLFVLFCIYVWFR